MKNPNAYTLFEIEGLKSPGSEENPCPLWGDWFISKDLDSEELEGYVKNGMWICVLNRAGTASSWFEMEGNKFQANLWQKLFEKVMPLWQVEK